MTAWILMCGISCVSLPTSSDGIGFSTSLPAAAIVERSPDHPRPLDRSQSTASRSTVAAATLGDTANPWLRVLLLRDYNTRVVVIGTVLLGIACGIVGSFALLRRRALMGDALSHATLPGIAAAFLVASAIGFAEKSLWLLLVGAAISGLLGTLTILAIRNLTRLKEDTALGIVLSVFFGLGIVLLKIAQQTSGGHAAGLDSFIYGKTASLLVSDAVLIGAVGLASVIVSLLTFKELKLLCFDEAFAGSHGLPVLALDSLLMLLIVAVTIIGLQAVGLILMIALLVIPPAAARFWTQQLGVMTMLAGAVGGFSCLVGALISAVAVNIPSGAMIVLIASGCFAISFLLGSERGVLMRLVRRLSLQQKVDRQHLLRALFELIEVHLPGLAVNRPAPTLSATTVDELMTMRSWSRRRLLRQLRRAEREGLIFRLRPDDVRLTEQGWLQATRLVHQHRLWEMYLITHADIAPSKVDRDADAIEHVLTPAMIAKLEDLVSESAALQTSPHPIFDTLTNRDEPRSAT